MAAYLQLLDWRRRVAAVYAAIRAAEDAPEPAWRRFVAARDELFANHPQSPLDAAQRRVFRGLSYYPYDPAYRFSVTIEPCTPSAREVRLRDDGAAPMVRFARCTLPLPAAPARLPLDWIGGYGGGVFLAFRDATAGSETYGGGRYVLDTIKGADLGSDGTSLLVDLNFAYNPSCAYNPRWHCPLPDPQCRVAAPIPVGERSPPAELVAAAMAGA